MAAADLAATRLGGSEVTLDYTSGWREPTEAGGGARRLDTMDAQIIEFPGYAYTRKPSAISGELVTEYDPTTPQIWRVPFHDRVAPALVVKAPLGGYVVPVAYADAVGAKLTLHGITFQHVTSRVDGARVEAFRAQKLEFSPTPFEGCMRVRLDGTWMSETQSIHAGALFVPIAQPCARLLMALLEPRAPDSFAAWGFFNACFEQKEHIEPYVAEQIAREMLVEKPELEKEFKRHLAEDPDFAASAAARLEFFLRRHSSWDTRLNLYPIFRVDDRW